VRADATVNFGEWGDGNSGVGRDNERGVGRVRIDWCAVQSTSTQLCHGGRNLPPSNSDTTASHSSCERRNTVTPRVCDSDETVRPEIIGGPIRLLGRPSRVYW
jgi:hypothetical protein